MGHRAQGVPAVAPRSPHARDALPPPHPLPGRLRLRGELRREGDPDAAGRPVGRRDRAAPAEAVQGGGRADGRRPGRGAGRSAPRRSGRRLRDPVGTRRQRGRDDRRRRVVRGAGGLAAHRHGQGRRHAISQRRSDTVPRGGGRAAPESPGRRALQPGPAHGGHHGPGPLRHHPHLRRDHRHGARRGPRTSDRHDGAACRHALPAARRLSRQDRAVSRHRRLRHGRHRGRGDADLRRALPRLGADLRAGRRALPLRHPGARRPHLDGVADAGPGDPVGDPRDGAAVPAERPLLPSLRDAVGGALDRLPATPDLVREDRPRRDGPRRTDRRSVVAVRRAGADGDGRVHGIGAALPAGPGAGGQGGDGRRRACGWRRAGRRRERRPWRVRPASRRGPA